MRPAVTSIRRRLLTNFLPTLARGCAGGVPEFEEELVFELDDEQVVGCLVLVLATAHCDDGIQRVGLEKAFEA